jgi:hypothetical protein
MRNVSNLNLVGGGQNMKMILTGLLVVFGFTTTIASADFLGETDDAYIGLGSSQPDYSQVAANTATSCSDSRMASGTGLLSCKTVMAIIA